MNNQLEKHLKNARRKSCVYPPATMAQVRSAEKKLGFEIPPLLARIYLEIGNGGRRLGPGFGILGLPGGYDNHDGWNIVKSSQEMAADFTWWGERNVICDWGCAMRSCIDCSDGDFAVYRWDGNEFDEATDYEDPSDEVWQNESESLEEWLVTPNCG